MTKVFTSNVLIESVKRRASIPVAQVTFQPADFLAFADEEISIGMLPSILKVHEDYLLYTDEVPLAASTSRYVIPHRSIGNKLREVAYLDNNDNIREMTRINREDLPANSGSSNNLYTYYIENNEVVIYPYILGAVTGSLLFSYYLRPNQMVTEDRVSIITSINRTTGEIFVNSIPSMFSVNSTYDFINSKSPFNTLKISTAVTGVNTITNVITVAIVNIPDRLSVGDYINLQEETIVPQIPQDLHVVLAHRVAARCLEAIGDTEGLTNANAKLSEMEMNTANLIENRVEGSPRKIINRNSHLSAGWRRRGRMR